MTGARNFTSACLYVCIMIQCDYILNDIMYLILYILEIYRVYNMNNCMKPLEVWGKSSQLGDGAAIDISPAWVPSMVDRWPASRTGQNSPSKSYDLRLGQLERVESSYPGHLHSKANVRHSVEIRKKCDIVVLSNLSTWISANVDAVLGLFALPGSWSINIRLRLWLIV